jgi:eukaryotic-like serine/threonine-protein kinase
MIGQKLGSFRIESKIGSGAMGAVYKAVHEAKNRFAAIKVITGEGAGKAKATERFKRESDILQQFRHPNIVRFLAVGRSQGTLYFAMEYVAGGTLEDLLERREYLPWPEAVELGIQLCDALHYAHEHGVVHRDLKPSNLMITQQGQLKLTDFGIAKDLDATALTATGRTLGTAAYMAPEQIRGTPEVSHKTDLYALGCVLYQMLTGEAPFAGKSAMVLMHHHLTTPPPRPSAKNPQVPRALDDLVVHLMAKDPNERPWDAAAAQLVLTDLRDKAKAGKPVPMVFNAPEKPTRPGTVPPAATGAAPPSDTIGARKSTKSGKSARPATSRALALLRFEGPWIETALLIAALVGVLAFAGYMLWPPSAPYLYAKAKALMASDKLSDWTEADREIVSELERRFPDHPYREEVRAWRDRIALEQARRRGVTLETSGVPAFREPKTEAEAQYVKVAEEARAYLKEKQDPGALDLWRGLAEALKDQPENRGWYLLALQRADELTKAMSSRRKTVAELLDQADAAERDGHPEVAIRLRRGVLERYGQFTHLKDLLDRAQVGIPHEEPPPGAKPDAGPR